MTHLATQKLPGDWKNKLARYKRDAAFEYWREQLSAGDTLPRGQFFANKKPGKRIIILDEAYIYKE